MRASLQPTLVSQQHGGAGVVSGVPGGVGAGRGLHYAVDAGGVGTGFPLQQRFDGEGTGLDRQLQQQQQHMQQQQQQQQQQQVQQEQLLQEQTRQRIHQQRQQHMQQQQQQQVTMRHTQQEGSALPLGKSQSNVLKTNDELEIKTKVDRCEKNNVQNYMSISNCVTRIFFLWLKTTHGERSRKAC